MFCIGIPSGPPKGVTVSSRCAISLLPHMLSLYLSPVAKFQPASSPLRRRRTPTATKRMRSNSGWARQQQQQRGTTKAPNTRRLRAASAAGATARVERQQSQRSVDLGVARPDRPKRTTVSCARNLRQFRSGRGSFTWLFPSQPLSHDQHPFPLLPPPPFSLAEQPGRIRWLPSRQLARPAHQELHCAARRVR